MEKLLIMGLTALFCVSGYFAFSGTNDPPSCAATCAKGSDQRYCNGGHTCSCTCSEAGYPVCTSCS